RRSHDGVRIHLAATESAFAHVARNAVRERTHRRLRPRGTVDRSGARPARRYGPDRVLVLRRRQDDAVGSRREAQARNTAGSRTEATRRDELRLVRRRDQNAHRGSGRGTLKSGGGIVAGGSGETSAAA